MPQSPVRVSGLRFGRAVLVVEDDPDIREALVDILQAEGFAVRQACHGQEALERVAESLPELVLLDLMMPVMDGLEFARRMHQHAQTSQVPILLVSADTLLPIRARDIGAAAYLCKPFEAEALLSTLRGVLGPPRHPLRRSTPERGEQPRVGATT